MNHRFKFAQSSAVYFNFTLEYAIKNLSSIGYDGIEIWGGRPHAYRDDLLEDSAKLKALIRDSGLEVCNFIPAQFRYPTLLCSDNERVRQDSVGYIASALRNAFMLGSPSVSLCPGMVPWDLDLKQGHRKLVQSLKDICRINESFGLKLLIEPAHRFESNLIKTIQDCVEILTEIDNPFLGILLDTGHCHVNGEDLSQALTLASGYPLHIHIDDNSGDADAHLNLGEGTIDFHRFRDALDTIHYKGYLSVELGTKYIMDPEAACRTSLTKLRELFGD
jgi:protein FrlC